MGQERIAYQLVKTVMPVSSESDLRESNDCRREREREREERRRALNKNQEIDRVGIDGGGEGID